MNIRVLSDLHLETLGGGPAPEPGSGEVLVLAGDTIQVNTLIKNKKARPIFDEFIAKAVKGYEKVIYVLGNHEYAGAVHSEVPDLMRYYLPEEVTVLEQDWVEHNGVYFVGATLWGDFYDSNADSIQKGKEIMDLYKKENYVRPNEVLTPEVTIEENKKASAYIAETVPSLPGPVVVITHYTPSDESLIAASYNRATLGSYSSPQEGTMGANDNLKVWIHGHVHDSFDYEIAGTRVVCNPKGNPGQNPDWNPTLEVSV